MRSLLRPILTGACVLSILACGGKKAAPPPEAAPAAAEQPTAAEPTTPEGIIAAFAAHHPNPGKDDPLRQPKSLEDVMEILRRDQLDLFPAGVDFLGKSSGAKAHAMRAQIELAWAEACTMAAEALGEEAERMTERAERRREVDAKKADEITAEAKEFSRTSEALMTVSEGHMTKGRELAEMVIAAAPDNYLGYRVAADYYRLLHKWEEFAEMVKKIEETNPSSNGLVFLRGAAASQRDFDFRKASEFYQTALKNDPKFTRAQMALMLGQENVGDLYEEFQKLQTMSPHHHLVLWAAAAIEADYQEWKADQAAGGE